MAQNTFDFAHFWSNLSTILAGKQATLTTAQQNAANSGITAAKVTQYDKDSAATAELVDSGAKNYVKYTPRTSTDSGITFDAKADGTVETSGTFPTGTTQTTMWLTEITLPAGNYHFSCKNGATFQTSDSFVQKTANDQTIARDISGYETFTLSESTTVRVVLRVRAGDETCVFKPMICTAADWAVSQNFVPYCPSMAELYAMIQALQS
jgi:hypothetical protein